MKAAFLKCAIDEQGLTRGVERILRAVGRAHVLTGAPVTVHTYAASRSGLVALRVLREEGADLSRVVIGHSGDSGTPATWSSSPTQAACSGWTGSASACRRS